MMKNRRRSVKGEFAFWLCVAFWVFFLCGLAVLFFDYPLVSLALLSMALASYIAMLVWRFLRGRKKDVSK